MKFLLPVAFSTLLVTGCSTTPPSITFCLSSARPEYELSYIPIVDDGRGIRIGQAFKKTADAAGYHEAMISMEYPENLATPWRTGQLDQFDRVGIVIFERTPDDDLVFHSGKVLWLDSEIGIDGVGQRKVLIPDLESLPSFDVEKIK